MALSPSSRARGLWWLSPAGAVTLVVLPTLAMALRLPDDRFRAAWGTPRWLHGEYVLLLLAGVAVFAVASLVPLLLPRSSLARPWPGLSPIMRQRLLLASSVVFWATMLGYLAYLAVGVARGARPADFVAVLVSQDTLSADLKEVFAPVAGVTTMTQFGIAYVVLGTVLLMDGPAPGVYRRLAIVGGAALMRAFFLSERLAILELIIPAVAVVAMVAVGSPRTWVSRATRWAPLIFAPAVIAVFGVFEYSRSWVFYQARTGGSFLDFAVERLSGYYTTAYNNGQMLYMFDAVPGRIPLRTLEVLWTAPVVEQLGVYDRLSPGGSSALQDLLAQKANPEFNNPCGLCDPFLDWGAAGGLLWWALAGLLLGLAYRAFCNGSLYLLLLYPPLVTGLFEVPRYLYWTQGRLAPALVALALIGWWAARHPQRAPIEWKDMLRV